jgi:hypothetical protein
MTASRDTIFALSSGRPPAAIAVVRISGPRAGEALRALIGRVPEPRRAALVRVRDPASGAVIDEALALFDSQRRKRAANAQADALHESVARSYPGEHILGNVHEGMFDQIGRADSDHRGDAHGRNRV